MAKDRGVYAARLEMTKHGDELHFDFTGSAAQVGIINSGSTGTRAGVFAAMLPVALIGEEVPGLRAVCSAASGSRAARHHSECRISRRRQHGIDRRHVARAQLRHAPSPKCCFHPEHRSRALSGGGGCGRRCSSFGWDKTGFGFRHPVPGSEPHWLRRTLLRRRRQHGWCLCIPAARVPNVEATEFTWPLLVLYRSEASDTGGAGRWRGGVGGKFAFILHKTHREFVHVSAAFHVAIPNGGALSGGLPGASVVYPFFAIRMSGKRSPRGGFPNGSTR